MKPARVYEACTMVRISRLIHIPTCESGPHGDPVHRTWLDLTLPVGALTLPVVALILPVVDLTLPVVALTLPVVWSTAEQQAPCCAASSLGMEGVNPNLNPNLNPDPNPKPNPSLGMKGVNPNTKRDITLIVI